MRIKDWAHALLGVRRDVLEDTRARTDIREAAFAPPARRNARRFEGAIFNRLTEDFAATTVAIDQELRGDLTALRNRARMLRKNDPYFIKFAKLLRANVVGANQPFGFTFQARVYDERVAKEKKARPDTLTNTAIEAGLAKFSRVCDVTGRHKSLRGLLR
jgi:capsid protein